MACPQGRFTEGMLATRRKTAGPGPLVASQLALLTRELLNPP